MTSIVGAPIEFTVKANRLSSVAGVFAGRRRIGIVYRSANGYRCTDFDYYGHDVDSLNAGIALVIDLWSAT